MQFNVLLNRHDLGSENMSPKLSRENIKNITESFYSKFCGTDISALSKGAYFVSSAERENEMRGLGCKYTIYILVKDGLCVVSYSPKYKGAVEPLRNLCADDVIAALNKQFKLKKRRLMVFDNEIISDFRSAKILENADYHLFETFFTTIFPHSNPEGWLYEYFTEKTADGLFTAYVSDNRLLSVCDAPDMPYMAGKIQHTGINTLKDERRKGYAKCAAGLAVKNLLEKGICPQWDCAYENNASAKLAEAVGYREYALAYILEE